MTLRKIVNPSDQTQAFLPQFVGENYQTFVNFMARSAESAERQGFGQDLLQNLQRYRDFRTYSKGIVESGVLSKRLDIDEEDELLLENGVGFPLTNGVVLVGDEVILYRTRNGNTLSDLHRAASATVVLPSLTSLGEYKHGPAQEYRAGTEVKNISSLFLTAMLSNIHQTFTPNIYSEKVDAQVDRSILLHNIKDFYGAKGSKLSVIALFKFIYGDADVDVFYPGDQMIRPSSASWQQFLIGNAIPFPIGLLGETGIAFDNKTVLGAQLEFRRYGEEDAYGKAVVEFATQAVLPEGVGFTLYLDASSFKGRVNLNKSETPSTVLKRNLLYYGSVSTIAADVTTVTVDSTNDFPESGVIFVGDEAIRYTSKSNNQFFGCSRAIDGHGGTHAIGKVVYGAEYAKLTLADGQSTNIWLGALYRGAEITDSGILYKLDDDVDVSLPGDSDYRDPILVSLQENTNDTLVSMTTTSNITDVTDVSVGISAIYYDDENVIVESSGLPGYDIGPFSTDGSVGPALRDNGSSTHVIPRKYRNNQIDRTGYEWQKVQTGTGRIGMYVDGTPIVSIRNGDKVVSGQITKFNVVNGGSDYRFPTVVLEPEGATAEVELYSGVITGVTVSQNANYTEIPTVRITEGEGAKFALTFDQWGRLTNVVILSGGAFYFDPPALVLVDQTGAGAGAALACTVTRDGRIDSVTITNPGLDYRPSTTELQTVTLGRDAVITAEVETYNFNRVEAIAQSATELKDSGNGILAALNVGDEKDTFAMAVRHTNLLAQLDTDESKHSSIIGWAYDGNPIYGPKGFINGVDDSAGVGLVAAGYSLQGDRTTVIPEGSTAPGTLPPDVATYPMGTFVEDYLYDPENASVVGAVQTELDQDILDDPDGRRLRYQFDFGAAILDEHNGRICNTPEFPADKYPDGVYCYFITEFGQFSQFPYVIGPTFRDFPTSQRTIVYDRGDEIINSTERQANFSDEIVYLKQKNMKRLRSLSIPDVASKPLFEITEIKSGGIDSVVCVQGSPDNATIRDTFYFANTGTGGEGAAAIVEELKGRDIISAGTRKIATRLMSHTQRINLIDEVNINSLVFIEGSEFKTNGGSTATVLNWNHKTGYLDVHVTSERLIRFGDKFRDNADNEITIPASKFPENKLFSAETAGSRSTYASWEVPDRTSATGGDLWWSAKTGRLYVYFDDGTNGNWVTTQPSGSRSFYADIEDTGTLESSSTTQNFATPQEDTAVTISTMAPTERADGTPNGSGDLWWSTHTGMLYIWVVETSTDDDDGTLKTNSQWVSTDPTAALSNHLDQSLETSILGTTPADITAFTQRVEVLMSDSAPLTMSDGGPLLPGTLWWSSASGKMYIYYTDADSSQWVVTNPTTVQSGPEALDVLVTGDGSEIDYLTLLPVPVDMTDLWFEPNMYSDDFEPGNIVEIRQGVPGNEDLRERVVIVSKMSEKGRYAVSRAPDVYTDSMLFAEPAPNKMELAHGAEVVNLSRLHFRVTCTVDHDLKVGEVIKVSGTGPGFDGKQKVYRIGKTKKASFTAVLTGDTVTSITIDDPGENYPERFYLNIYGGGGLGATAVAFIDEDGKVESTFVLTGGSGYTSAPSVTHYPKLTTNEFLILVGRDYGDTPNFSYTTTAEYIFGTPSKIRMLSRGQGYLELPEVVGLVRSEDIRAEAEPILDGTQIAGFNVTKVGFGYIDPIVVIDDLTSAGSGASATVRLDENGAVKNISVTNPGSGYVEPVVTLVEGNGTYLATTKDIGRITGFQLLEPSSIVNADSVSYPELQPPLRIVSSVVFAPAEEIWQGDSQGNNKLFSATVESFNEATHVATLINYDGEIDITESIYGESGQVGTVFAYDEADFKLSTSSFVKPAGRFIDSTGMISDQNSVIQDSLYYQTFSYVISSSKQKEEFENVVDATTHPAGCVMFAETRLEFRLQMGLSSETAIIG
ncbi:baseplate wedge protein, intermediate [Synechococcus phage S-CREM2]|nr:baseplate wedge protein, intermediate [Synechococcus phage S-CREM2]